MAGLVVEVVSIVFPEEIGPLVTLGKAVLTMAPVTPRFLIPYRKQGR